MVYDGCEFRSRRALARHLAAQLELSANTVVEMLRKHDDDAGAMLGSYSRHVIGRIDKPPSSERRPYSRHVIGRIDKPPSRMAHARALVPILGLSIDMLTLRLKALNDDPQAVVRYYQVHGIRRPRSSKPIEYEGQLYPSRRALATALAAAAGRSLGAIQKLLRRHHDDAAAVLAICQTTTTSPRIKPTEVAGHTYASQADYARDLHHRYQVKTATAEMWIGQRGPEAALTRARAFAARQRQYKKQHPQDNTVVVFGWRWRSLSALCGYYRVSHYRHFKREWEDHVERDGRPGFLFRPLANRLARWWEVGELNEWNRFDPVFEARLPRRLLPLNNEPEEITDPMERSMVDALQPPEVTTVRRACLRRLERLKAGDVTAL
jgi:hypothetical protein